MGGPTGEAPAAGPRSRGALEDVYDGYVANLPVTNEGRARAQFAARNLEMRVAVEGSGGRLPRTGDLSAIFAEMDLREVERVVIFNSSADHGGMPSIRVELGIDREYLFVEEPSLLVRVTGDDRQWVGGVFDVLATHIAADVPYWSAIRSRWVAVVLGAVLAAGLFGAAFATSSQADQQNKQLVTGGIALTVITGVMSGIIILRPMLRRLFPAFEIVEAGSPARGRKVLGVLVGLLSLGLGVAGVVLGVLAL